MSENLNILVDNLAGNVGNVIMAVYRKLKCDLTSFEPRLRTET